MERDIFHMKKQSAVLGTLCLQRLPLDLHGALDLVPLCDQTSSQHTLYRPIPCRRAGIGGGSTGPRTGAFQLLCEGRAGCGQGGSLTDAEVSCQEDSYESACTAWQGVNASNRRGSIDYLIANTKRLKVGRSPSPLKETRGESPSPVPMENHEGPLPLHPRRIEGTRLDASCACDDGPDAGDMHSEARGLEFGLGTNANGPQLSLGTVINSLQEMSLASRHVGGGTMGAMHRGNTRDQLNLCGEWSTAAVPGIDPKFLCYKDNEVNLMYHFWLFPDAPLDGGCVRQEVLEMGVFQPLGVTPVHQNLRDGGVAFHYMEHRTVCIHNGAFSPENAQLELVRGNHLHVFFSAARSSNNNNRRVIAYHVVPGNIDVEQRLRDTVGQCTTLSELVEGLSSDFPEPGATIHTLINSLQR
eukprot:Em0013g201a